MNKNDIKQIILEEIEFKLQEIAGGINIGGTFEEDEDGDDDEITPPGPEDMPGAITYPFSTDTDIRIRQLIEPLAIALYGLDPVTGDLPTPTPVTEMPRKSETWYATPKMNFMLKYFVGQGGEEGLVQAMIRINDVLKKTQNVGFKSRAKKYQTLLFLDQEGNLDINKVRGFARLLLNSEGFAQKDIQSYVGFKNSAQANAFKIKLYKAKLIDLKPADPDERPDMSEGTNFQSLKDFLKQFKNKKEAKKELERFTAGLDTKIGSTPEIDPDFYAGLKESKKKLNFDLSQVNTPEKLPIDVEEQDLMDNIKKELKSSAEDYQNDDNKKTADRLKDAVSWVDKNGLKGKVTLEQVHNFLTKFHNQLPENDKMFLHEPTILELIEDEFKPYVKTEEEYQKIVSSVKQYLSSKQPQTMPKSNLKEILLASDYPEAHSIHDRNLRKMLKDLGIDFKDHKKGSFASVVLTIQNAMKAGNLQPLKYGLTLEKIRTELQAAVKRREEALKQDYDMMRKAFGPGVGLEENTNKMTNLEKYIKKVIKEAKNPLAKKMKEVEQQGRKAALETKLAAIDEMIEETQGRLTRIDEDNEFRDMMDKNAVKEVRKQLKELERAKAKLQKEYGKMGKMGLPKNYDEDKKKVMDEESPVDEVANEFDETLAKEVDAELEEIELEEDNFALNESVKRMQKLANLKG
jgi:hypothetical protein